MKYGLYVAKPFSDEKNIGDYIQSLAAMQFVPRVDEFYNREEPDHGGEEIKMIMNAWYMWKPECFPPSQRVKALPVSMHLSPLVREKLLASPIAKQWFKDHEPIGCRDKGTEEFLQTNGIRAYFSGCLTLTLGEKYHGTGLTVRPRQGGNIC